MARVTRLVLRRVTRRSGGIHRHAAESPEEGRVAWIGSLCCALLLISTAAVGACLGRGENANEVDQTVVQLAAHDAGELDRSRLWIAADQNLGGLWIIDGDMAAPAVRPLELPDVQPDDLAPEPVAAPVVPATDRYDSGTVNWRRLVLQYDDWPVETMLRINNCESGGRADAINYYNSDGLFDYGGWQIHGDPRGLDPVVGTAIAHEKYQAGGVSPWNSSRRCWG